MISNTITAIKTLIPDLTENAVRNWLNMDIYFHRKIESLLTVRKEQIDQPGEFVAKAIRLLRREPGDLFLHYFLP